MPPILATLLWLIVMAALMRFDPARNAGISVALWIPLSWMFIVGSRLPAVWMEGGAPVAGSLEDGNVVDRCVFMALIALAMTVLTSRRFRWTVFMARNRALLAFLGFGLVSALWSDFPLVTLKRWFRDLGHFLVVLVVLSDSHPMAALTTLLRRLFFVLISLSILLIKYYPELGRSYDWWTGSVTYTGVTTSKYLLASVCMISGIYFFWDTVIRWPTRRERQTRLVLYVNLVFIAMTLWVLKLADGATCTVCLVIGCIVIAAANRTSRRSSRLPKYLIPTFVCILLVSLSASGLRDLAAPVIGRDATFTDRTLLWSQLLTMNADPILGTGYESFWLGSRLQQIHDALPFSKPNQAHNGYLEVYLNLGWVGLLLLIGFITSSYGKVWNRVASSATFGSFGLALWTVLPICNVTTAAFFKNDLSWLAFLLATLTVPLRQKAESQTDTGSLQ